MSIINDRLALLAESLSDAGWGIVIIVPCLTNSYRITAERWSGKASNMAGCNYSLSSEIIQRHNDFRALTDAAVDTFEDLWNASGYA